jgi:hypothetical protein
MSNKMQRYRVYFIWKLLDMFRVLPSPIIRSAKTVSTASGICHSVTATCRYRGKVGTGLSVLWVAYATHSTLKPDVVVTHFALLMMGGGTNRNM